MNSDNEIRFVHREETFNDLAVRELADGRSACICRLQFGRCKKKECKTCQIMKEYANCYNSMNDYDKQRLAKYVSEKYRQDSLYPEKWMSHKRLILRVLAYCSFCFVIFPIIIVSFVLLLSNEPRDIPDRNSRAPINVVLPSKYHGMIVNVCTNVINNIYDTNKDNRIDCIDYTLCFKRTWDRLYPECRFQCMIIRNYNTNNGMHHLYIVIYDDDYNAYFIEPFTSNPYRYRTVDLWDYDSINHNYDIWNETNYWLNRYNK